jgi:Eco57I restriction-modification methylase
MAPTRKCKRLNDIDAFLTDNLAIKKDEKDALGEVFTPVSIVDQMLALLPGSVWSNPKLTWLDPACGIGNFPLKVLYGGEGYPGLLEGLAKAIPNRARRIQHILKKMLFSYDINAANTRMLKETLACLGPANVVTADFLDIDKSKRFDIILGNPPYNAGGTKRDGDKRLHVQFTELALQLLTPKGQLLFICPPNWREAGSTMNRLFQEAPGCMKSVVMIGAQETHKLFKIQGRVDIFLYDHSGKGQTHILDERGAVCDTQLDLTRHVPNFGLSIFEKLRARPKAPIRAFRSAEASTAACVGFSEAGRYPILHLMVEEGRKVLRRTKKHTLQGKRKIMLNGLGVPYVYYDKEGTFGPSQVPVVIVDPPAKLVTFMKSKLFYLIVWALRITGNNNLPYIFEDVPAGYGAGIKWTKEEQALINSFEVPVSQNKIVKVSCSKTRKASH